MLPRLPTLLAAALGAAACSAVPLRYEPAAPVRSPARARWRASVAPVLDLTRPTTRDDERRAGGPTYNFASGEAPQAWLSPESLTGIIAEDLSASGLFAAVDRDGAGTADVVVRPALKRARATRGGLAGDVWDFALQVDVIEGDKVVLSKVYRRTWRTDSLGMAPDALARDVREVMNEMRGDLARSL